jgi:hypothetical protein
MCLSVVIYSFDEMVGSLKRIRGREEKNGLRRVLGGWAAPSNSSLFVASQIQLSHRTSKSSSPGVAYWPQSLSLLQTRPVFIKLVGKQIRESRLPSWWTWIRMLINVGVNCKNCCI